jgi:aryl-alcohol dehydrogenase-like predicted oxidoreductase
MEYGNVPGIDKPISRLVQGTIMIRSEREAECFALLDAVLEMGCTTFDTAHGYGGGDVERTVGKWVRERGVRDEIVIIGKGAHHNQDRQRVTPFDITADIHDSLARFGFDFIDLYLLHRDDPSQPVGPIVETLNEHKAAGRIGVFGGSNWSIARLEEANAYAAARGLEGFTASSPNFSLAEQAKPPWPNCITLSGPQAAADRAWYEANRMPLFTWSSLAGGFFSGRFRRDNLDEFDSYLDKLCVETYCFEDNFRRLDRVMELAEAKGMSIPQIATAYVLSVPLNIFALVGCWTPDEFRENLAAAQVKLTPVEIAWLEMREESIGG